jgi:hypothetical protein
MINTANFDVLGEIKNMKDFEIKQKVTDPVIG